MRIPRIHWDDVCYIEEPVKVVEPVAIELVPQDATVFIQNMKEILHQFHNPLDEEERIVFSAIIHNLHRMSISLYEDGAVMHKGRLDAVRTQERSMRRSELDKLDEILSRARKSHLFGHFEAGASTLGLATSAIASGLTGAWSVVALVALIGFADYNKQNLAESIAKGDSEKEAEMLQYLQVGVAILSVALSLRSKTSIFTVLTNATSGAATLSRGTLDHRNNRDRGELLGHKAESRSLNDQVETLMNDLHKALDAISERHNAMSIHARSKLDTAVSMIRA